MIMNSIALTLWKFQAGAYERVRLALHEVLWGLIIKGVKFNYGGIIMSEEQVWQPAGVNNMEIKAWFD